MTQNTANPRRRRQKNIVSIGKLITLVQFDPALHKISLFSFQLDCLVPGLCGRHPELLADALQLPAVHESGHGSVRRPQPHRLHHRSLGPGHPGQLLRPGTQILALKTL